MNKTSRKKEIDKNFCNIFNKILNEENERRKNNQEKPLTYNMIANELGVTTQTITNYTTGKRTPRYEQIRDLKKFLNTSYERLFKETESNKVEYMEVVDNLGLSSTAIEILENRNKQQDNWGIPLYNEEPNLYFFALNQLIINNPLILVHIGDLLSYPTKTNKYLDKETLDMIVNQQVDIPNIELYSYRIAKDLEDLQKITGELKAVADFSENKLNVQKVLNEEHEKYNKKHQKYIKEEERIQKEIDENK